LLRKGRLSERKAFPAKGLVLFLRKDFLAHKAAKVYRL
jgi:hypothetical protein